MHESHIIQLKARHAQLEERIASELKRPAPDSALVSLLKKMKLKVKQQLASTAA